MTDRSRDVMANRPRVEVGVPGGLWYEDADGVIHALPIPVDWATVPYVLGIAAGLPSWVVVAADVLQGFGNAFGEAFGQD